VPYLLFMFANPSGFDENATNRYVIRRIRGGGGGGGGGWRGRVGVLNIERSPLDFVFLAESAVESDAGLVAVAGFADTVDSLKGLYLVVVVAMILFKLIKVGY
jgi:hypothetical protein